MRRPLVVVCLTILVINLVSNANAADLKPEPAAAFDLYVRTLEAQMESDVAAGRFLILDRLPDAQRQQAYEQVQRGGAYIERQEVLDQGRRIRVPSGLIHHWAGVIFIPGATLDEVNGMFQNFDGATTTFKPFLERFQPVGQDGDATIVAARMYYKSILTVTFNVTLNLRASARGDGRMLLSAHSTRVAELRDAGESNEHELPVGRDDGFLWRLNAYWHLEQKDGGVYVGLEVVELSRGIPAPFIPIVKPLTESIPRNLLAELLGDVRTAVRSSTTRSR